MPVISTQNLEALPDILGLKRLTQSIAMLEAIVELEWEMRYYSFNSRWADGEMMASMRDGSENSWFLLFSPAGAAMKGFALHSPMARNAPWPGVLSEVPSELGSFLAEPAFSMSDATYCIWRGGNDESWSRGRIAFPEENAPDGSQEQLAILDGDPETYRRWAQEYYEVDLPSDAVAHLYAYRPLTPEIAARLNPNAAWEELASDIEEIGYPVAVDGV